MILILSECRRLCVCHLLALLAIQHVQLVHKYLNCMHSRIQPLHVVLFKLEYEPRPGVNLCGSLIPHVLLHVTFSKHTGAEI